MKPLLYQSREELIQTFKEVRADIKRVSKNPLKKFLQLAKNFPIINRFTRKTRKQK